ncbi:MAG: CoA transferase [Chloroflexi bacterium]|nr:CoA transferase [Chloroflexota bacterium]
MGLLSDLRVVEWGRLVSGPYCAKLLADLGADVIKVEPPAGDPCRLEPPFPGDVPHPERSGLFQYLNTSKRGITLDLETAAGRGLLHQLLAQADLLVENQPRRLARRLGLDEPQLRRRYPGLVVASVSPFGRTGPYRDFQGTDLTLWAAGGFSHLTPRFAADAAVAPLKVGGRQPEYLAGANAAAGALCALLARRALGRGQQVDVSEQESVASVLHGAVTKWSYQGQVASRVAQHMGAPNEAHLCKDGYMHLQCTEEHQWHRFVELMGTPEWSQLPVFATTHDRGENYDAFSLMVEDWSQRYTKQEILDQAAAARLPFAPLQTMAEVFQDPQVRYREAIVAVEHPEAGPVPMPGAPYKLSGEGAGSPWALRPAPRLGEHNLEVLERLGYSRADCVRLRQMGAI